VLPGYACLFSGAMISATSSAGRGAGLMAGEGPQADCEGFALAGVPVLGNQFRELARGIVIPGGERDGGLDEGACDIPGGFWSGGQDEGELVQVRGFDEIEGMLGRDGCVGDDLVHLINRHIVSQVQNGQVLPASFFIAVAGEQITRLGICGVRLFDRCQYLLI
jgi:hypothetical protein